MASDVDPAHDPQRVAIAVEDDTGLDVVVNRAHNDLRVAHQIHTTSCGSRHVTIAIADLANGDEICVGEYAERFRAWSENFDLDDIEIIEIEHTIRITTNPATGHLAADRPRSYRP